MSNEVYTIKDRKVVLPTWLDTIIFDDLSASYCRQKKIWWFLNGTVMM